MFAPHDLRSAVQGVDKAEMLAARAQELQRRRAELDADEADLVVEAERWRMDGLAAYRNTEAFLRNATGVARSTAQTKVRAYRQLLVLPTFWEALRQARLTFDHVRIVAAHADSPNRDELLDAEDEILGWALESSADDFRDRMATWARDLDEGRDAGLSEALRRSKRQRVTTRRLENGLNRTILDFDDETQAVVMGFVRSIVAELRRGERKAKVPLDQRRTHGQLWAAAFVEAARRGIASDIVTKHRARPTILALTEMSVLWDQLRVNGVCELEDGTQLTGAQLRKMACEADIIPIVLSGDGVPLDLGRTARLATYKQRLALRSLHPTCAAEGCDVDFDDCEIHHLKPWENGGKTDLANLVPLCWYHHHLVHDADGEVRHHELLPDRTLRFIGLPLVPTPRRRHPLVQRLKRPPDLAGARR